MNTRNACELSDGGVKTMRKHRRSVAALALLLTCTALSTPAFADAKADAKADAAADAAADSGKEIVVNGSLNALPLKDVGTIFGFNKTLVETPRSASTVSKEQLERFGVTSINDLVAQAPGTFTESFFGVAGGLDIRGTPGEVYFRGMRRLDNPGNYPQPLGASDRIDIVRGPASPIYGPSKTGGYMNFVPRTARAADGKYMDKPEVEGSYTFGSWGKNVLDASVRGPAKIGGHDFGYSLYGQVEDSGSYYRYMFTRQSVAQASIETDLASNVRLEFGGMYHHYHGQQNGGWNRLTQDLIDHGTYITGSAQPVDANGDGVLEPEEFRAKGSFSPFYVGGTSSFSNANTALTNVGTTTLSRKDVLTGPNDKLINTAKTAYMDVIWNAGHDWEIKNQLFYDGYTNLNENAYGFAQFHDSYVIEDKITVSKKIENSLGKFQFQLSPALRYTNFKHGDDFGFEFFHRVDLTQGYTALSTRRLATQCDCEYSTYLTGDYLDTSIAGMTDLAFNFGLDVTLGARYDSIHVYSASDPTRTAIDDINGNPIPNSGSNANAAGTKGGWSWTASANYKLPYGLIPYVTASRQTTIIDGQGAEVAVSNITGNNFMSASMLYEGGVKGSWLGGKLYAALSIYNQKRTDYSSQSSTVNQAVETRGIEAEARWSVDKHLLLTAAYTKTKVYNITFLHNGSTFSFLGVQDLINSGNFSSLSATQIGQMIFGGQPGWVVPIPNLNASRRAGIPDSVISGTASYQFDNGLAFAAALTHVNSTFSGQSQSVRLPAYTLLDLSASFKTGPFLFRVTCKNCTDATYYRANFTELFGSTIVLPEKPRSYQATVEYKF